MDTTACDTTRFFAPIQLNGPVHTHMQHDQVWSSRQKAAATKIVLEAIFVVCRSDSIKKIAKENSFHRNLTWIYKFMTQEIVFEVTVRYRGTSSTMSNTF